MTTTKTKTDNITNKLKTAPSIAITYSEMIATNIAQADGVTKFVQEFKGVTLEKFDNINLELHKWENWKFRTKNGLKCAKNAIKKPQDIATKLSAIRTFLKYGEKITSETDYETIRKFIKALKSTDESPETILKSEIKSTLKGLSVEQLKSIQEFISKI